MPIVSSCLNSAGMVKQSAIGIGCCNGDTIILKRPVILAFGEIKWQAWHKIYPADVCDI